MAKTRYSLDIEGDKGNYHAAVRFDYTNGYIGIDQWITGRNATCDRVLLTPVQVQELIAFVRRQGRQGDG